MFTANRAGQLRIIQDGIDLEELFLFRVTRRVRLDATISLDSRIFEAPVALRGRDVQVRYNPFNFKRVEVWLNNQFIGNATLCDKYLNSRTFEKENYAKSE